jgi:hypothetical protein
LSVSASLKENLGTVVYCVLCDKPKRNLAHFGGSAQHVFVADINDLGGRARRTLAAHAPRRLTQF